MEETVGSCNYGTCFCYSLFNKYLTSVCYLQVGFVWIFCKNKVMKILKQILRKQDEPAISEAFKQSVEDSWNDYLNGGKTYTQEEMEKQYGLSD